MPLDKRFIVYILWDTAPVKSAALKSSGKGDHMFEVTEKAGEVIRKLLEGKDPQSVRIMMTEGG